MTLSDRVQFVATIVSPFLLAWVAFASSAINNRVEHQNKIQQDALDRQDRLQKEAIARQDQLIAHQDELLEKQFQQSGVRFDHTRTLFADLTNDDPQRKRLAVLTALAFVHEGTLPEFMLPVLAINESKDAEIGAYLRQGVKELLVSETVPETVRKAALRALEELASPEDIARSSTSASSEPNLRANAQAITDVASDLVGQIAATNTAPAQLRKAKEQLQQLAPTLSVLAIAGPDEATKSRAATLLQKASVDDSHRVEQAVSALAANLPPGTKLTPRVYLHIADESQRSIAQAFKQVLVRNGYLVPGIQNVAGKGYIPDTLEVRYFAEDSKTVAEELLRIIKENGAKDGRVSFVIPSSTDLKVSSDIKSHFEVWAGKKSI